MKIVVITGSSQGIGYGLAKQFLALGCAVVINGRDSNKLDQARQILANEYDTDRILAFSCDVSNFAELQALWDKAISHFGKVDIWINNAGTIHKRYPVWQQTPEKIKMVIETNLLGSIYGAKVAISGMIKQGFGSVYLMEGAGSSGNKLPNLTLYGTTKYGIRYLTQALIKETKDTPIIVGTISPGVVVTDLLTSQYDETQKERWEKVKPILNIVADKVETVTPWLAQRILNNQKKGARIAWLTLPKVIWRFLCSPIVKRDLFLP